VRELETALWVEVILSGYEDFCEMTKATTHPFWRRWYREDARRWIFSEDTSVGSIRFCCEAIGIDPAAIRRGLRKADIAKLRNGLKIPRRVCSPPACRSIRKSLFEYTSGDGVSAAGMIR
jgi:hypothetical protein